MVSPLDTSGNPNRACFLDRDGVLIEDAHYLSSPDQVRLMPGISGSLRRLRQEGYLLIVVTNQSGVARGVFPEDAIPAVHQRIDDLLAAEGAGIDAYYYCPHHVEGTVKRYARSCSCRKPEPGMLLAAATDYRLDLGASFLIGDKLSDLQAAEKAGCAGYLVETGHGREYAERGRAAGIPVVADAVSAVYALLETAR